MIKPTLNHCKKVYDTVRNPTCLFLRLLSLCRGISRATVISPPDQIRLETVISYGAF
jgi:hypothetical protein